MKRNIKNSRLWKRLFSGVMTAAMLLGLLPGLPGMDMTTSAAESAAESTQDAYGFELNVPDSFDPDDGINPYGSAAIHGHVNFSPVKELGIFESAADHQISTALNMDRGSGFQTVIPTDRGNNRYKNNDSLLTGALPGNTQNHFRHNYDSYLDHVRGVAYDPNGTGKDDHIVYYGFGSKRYSVVENRKNVPGFIEFDATKGATSEVHYLTGWEGDYSWIGDRESWRSDGYNALVAGDFDGDGKDTIMIYDPQAGGLSLKEYIKVDRYPDKTINIGNDKTLAGYFNNITLNDIQKGNPNAISRNTAIVHLTAGDLDGDGDEELVATISLGDLDAGKEGAIGGNSYEDKGGSTASVVAVYNKEGSSWKMVHSSQLANVYDAEHQNNKSYKGWFMRSAASAIGDVDGDGSPEIVTVGLPADDLRHNDDDLWGRDVMVFTVIDCGSGYSLRMVDNPTKQQSGDTSAHPDRIPEGWYIPNNAGGNFGDWAPAQSGEASNPPLSIGCVQLEGTGTTPYVFARGHIFRFADSGGKWKFNAAKHLGDTGSNENVDRPLQDMNYMGQPVIANFDGNKEGRQQIFFVVGTRNTGELLNGARKDNNWIVGLTYDPVKGNNNVMEGTGLYSSRWKTNVIDRYNDHAVSVVLTAPDIDKDDGLLAQYKRKQYTWADPEIMAILEASPYFEDLVDEYAETAGSTTFGTGKGSGTGTSETSSTRAGAYMSFSQDFGPFGFNIFSAEMEASFESEWSSEVAMTTEYEYEMSFETGRDYNQVLLTRIPVIVYTYEVTDPSGNKSEMNITTAERPLYCMIPVEKYNEMARSLSETVIGSDIVSAVPGQPDTYRSSTNELTGKNPQTLGGNWIDSGGGGNSVVTQSITKINTEEITTSLTHNFDTKAGAGVLGLTLGVSGGYSQGKAQSTTKTESVTRAGTVSSVPADYASDYGFQWQFMTWDAKIDDYTVPVLSYLVKNVKQPPSLPQNVNAVAESDSITLSWEAGFTSAEKYEVYRYLDSDKSYNYVGTVMGNAADNEGKYTYEITGLTPGMSYSYSLRAVGGGRYSAYTEPLTVVTASTGTDLPNILLQPKDQNLRPGGNAGFTVTATSGGGESLTFQWQTRKAGQIAWKNIQNANSAALTIANVTEDMDGNQYRCQVSQLSSSSDTKVFVYSDPATLSVGKADSQTTVEVSGEGGTADYVTKQEGTATTAKIYAVTIGDDTNNYYAYDYTIENPYYYCLDDSKYYRLAGLTMSGADASQTGVVTATADSRTELANLSGALVQTADSTTMRIANTDELHSTKQDTAIFEGVVYDAFTAQGVAVTEKDGQPMYTLSESTLTLYRKQNDKTDTQFYVEAGTYNAETESADMSLKKVTQASAPDSDTETLQNLTYFGTPKIVWSDTDYEIEGEYTVLTFGDGTTKIYQKGNTYCTRTENPPEEEGGDVTYTYNELTLLSTTEEGTGDAIVTTTPLGTVGADGAVSDRIGHKSDSAAETTMITTTTQIPTEGDVVTLTANVASDSKEVTGTVVFRIVNTTTGSEQKVEATLVDKKATVEWTPTAAGVYQITATYQGSGSFLPSGSPPVTYYAYVNPETTSGYRLNLAESLPYGDTIMPSLVRWKEENGKITETDQSIGDVTYTAYAYLGVGTEGTDADGYSKTAVDGWQRGDNLNPGNYLIRAAWGESNTASVKLTVTTRAVTVTAPALDTLSADRVDSFVLADYLKEIAVTGGILEADANTYGGAAEGYPNLFRLTGGPKPSAGSYDIQVDYAANGDAPTEEQEAAYTDFLSKYLPALLKNVVYVEADVVNVTYGAGTNGSLTAQINGSNVASGAAVPTGSQLIFTAKPDNGFHVSRWTINGEPVTSNTAGVTLIPEQNALIVNSVAAEMDIRVEFSNESYTVSFSADNNGAVSAATAEGTPISSGVIVVGGSAVTFTAQPMEDYVVESWIVNNEVQKNEDGSNYSAGTFTLENISEDTTVKVTFAGSVDYTVTFTAVDSETGETLTTGVTLLNDGLDAEGKAAKGSSVTLTAKPNVGNAILEWQAAQQDGTWATLAGAQQSYTIQNLQSDMNIRVRVNTNATTYSVNFGVYAEGNLETPAADAGTLSAAVNGAPIENGAALPNGSDVAFAYTEPENYEFVRWEVSGQEFQENGTTCTVENLMANTTVKAVVRQKPQVTIAQAEHGTVTVTANGQTIESGAYVHTGTELTVTAKPNDGYVVGNLMGTAQDKSNGEKTAIATANGSITITAEFTAKPTVNFTADQNGGTVEVTGTADGENVTLKPGDYVDFGSALTVTAKPNDGYVASALMGTDQGKSNGEKSYTISNVQENQNITAEFAAKPTVNFTADQNGGTVEVTGTADGENVTLKPGDYVDFGSALTVTAKPNDGYVASTLMGTDQGKSNGEKTYTISNVQENQNITAEFIAKPTVHFTADQNEGTVEVTGTANGASVALAPGDYVDFGSALTVIANPEKGYEVDESIEAAYTDGSGKTTDDKAYTISDVQTNQDITVSWQALPTQDITFSVVETTGAGGTYGSLTAAVERKGINTYTKPDFIGGSIYRDSSVTFTAVADPGYRVKEWTIGGEVYTAGDDAFIGNILTLPYEVLTGEVTVQFELGNARIVFTNPDHGTLTAVSAGLGFTSGGSSGAEVVFTLTPDENYEVKAWKVNGGIVEGETDTEFVYTPDGTNVTIAAELQGVVLEITAEAGSGGTVSGLPEEVRYGEEVILTAVPDAGYAFDGWYRNDARIEDADAKYTFIAAESASYEARFVPTANNTVTFLVNNEEMGAIAAAADGVSITSGDRLAGGQTIIFTVTPAEGYRVKEWNGLPGNAEISTDKTIATVPTLSGVLTVQAVLEAIPQHTITLETPTGEGTITAQVNGQDVTQVPDGTIVTFTASPAPGWMLDQWIGDAAEQTAQSFTMEITKDVTIGAVFEGAVHYTVKYNVDGANGSISAKANGSADVAINTEVQFVANSSIVFTALPENGYMVAKWTVNDVEQDMLSNTLTIDKLSENTVVIVTFEAYQGFVIPVGGVGYTIADIERNPADTYAGAPESEIRKGGDVTFTVKLAENYTNISQMVINGYDCITKSGTAENCEKVDAVKNSDGSYTVTIFGVIGNITTDIKAHQLTVGALTVPDEFENDPELNSEEKIQSKLSAAVTGGQDGIVYYDIALKYFDAEENTWVEVDEINFPKNGVDVVLSYPDGTESKDTFTIVHMLTTGENPGETEIVNHSKEGDGLHFHVNSLSPFAVSWEKYEEPVTPPSHGGGGGGGSTTRFTVTFDTQGGSAVDKKTVSRNATVEKPADPTREGYIFDGWYTDKDCTQEYDFDSKVTKNMTLYAKWIEDKEEPTEPTDPTEPNEWENPFVDVKDGDWFYGDVQYAHENNLFAGISDTEFGPNNPMTRAMLVTVLYRAEGEPSLDDEILGYPFADVNAESWYGDAVYWARLNGIVKGISDEEFAPDQEISREQIAAILERYADFKGIATEEIGDLTQFTDAAQISDWAKENVAWAVGAELISGKGDGILDPLGNATRAEVAAILHRFIEANK